MTAANALSSLLDALLRQRALVPYRLGKMLASTKGPDGKYLYSSAQSATRVITGVLHGERPLPLELIPHIQSSLELSQSETEDLRQAAIISMVPPEAQDYMHSLRSTITELRKRVQRLERESSAGEAHQALARISAIAEVFAPYLANGPHDEATAGEKPADDTGQQEDDKQ